MNEEQNQDKNKRIEVLKDPDLFYNILTEFDKRIAGEEVSRTTLFLLCCSIWVENMELPQHCLVNSNSSAGKDFLVSNVLKIFPQEVKEYRSRISPKAFTYWHNSKFEPEWTWDGKILYLEDVEEEVINSPVFKVMGSKGSITTIVIQNRAVDIEIKGKPCLVLTTAESYPNNEIINRMNSIILDESDKQTKKVKEFVANELKCGKKQYNPIFQEALKELKRVEINIPFIDLLVNYFPDVVEMRREFGRVMGFISCSAALHQYQRERDEEGRVIANDMDYEIARFILKGLQTNEAMVKLTHQEKKIYEYAKETCQNQERFEVKQLYEEYGGMSLKHYYFIINKLTDKGLFETTTINKTDVIRPVRVYKIKKFGSSLGLPDFKELIGKNSKYSYLSKLSNYGKLIPYFTKFTILTIIPVTLRNYKSRILSELKENVLNFNQLADIIKPTDDELFEKTVERLKFCGDIVEGSEGMLHYNLGEKMEEKQVNDEKFEELVIEEETIDDE